MIKLEKYNPEKVYMFPNGDVATPEKVQEHFPAAAYFVHVVETDQSGEVLGSMENLSMLRGLYEIDPVLDEEEAIRAIEDIRNAPPPEMGPDASERIAAALEFQNAIVMQEHGLSIEPELIVRNVERGLWSADQAVMAAGEDAVAMGIVDSAEYGRINNALDGEMAAVGGKMLG